MFPIALVARQFTSDTDILNGRLHGIQRRADFVYRPIGVSQQQNLRIGLSMELLHHPTKGTRSLPRSRRTNQQEIVLGTHRFGGYPFKIVDEMGVFCIFSLIKVRFSSS
jgi:hypothetical protein